MTRKSPLLAFDYAKQDVRDSVRILEEQPRLPSFTVAQLNAIPDSALEAGQMAYCTNEAGGAVPVFFDGTDWRRVTDRSVIA